MPDESYITIPNDTTIEQTAVALNSNGFHTRVVEDAASAKQAVLELVPKGAQVFTATSDTLESTGINEALNSSVYTSVRKKLGELRQQPDKTVEMKQLGSTPDYIVVSAHALTQDGKILVASATGSQIPAEVYGANHVVYVVGAQKIVHDVAEGVKRIEQHIVPLEEQRIQKMYGAETHTAFRKLLVFNNEHPGRIEVVIVKQNLGY